MKCFLSLRTSKNRIHSEVLHIEVDALPGDPIVYFYDRFSVLHRRRMKPSRLCLAQRKKLT
jgi:hypothetical protein